MQTSLRAKNVRVLPTSFICLATLCGCQAPTSRLTIHDYQDSGGVRRLSGAFEEGYYALDPGGNLDLILRHSADEEKDRPGATQIVRVSTVWRSIPGQTTADETQINGTVTYAILGRGVDSTYEGAGSVFFAEDSRTGALKGRLNRVILKPARRRGDVAPLFDRVELAGTFYAELRPHRTRQMMNEMDQLFGPRTP